MSKRQIVGLGGLMFFLFVSLFSFAGVNQASAHSNGVTTGAGTCADPPEQCKAPVKYLGEKDSCACFACEHGKQTQRIICTANEDGKVKLMALVRAR